MEQKPIHLDGRDFRGVSESLTAAQDDYLLAHLRRSGVLEVLADETLSREKRAEEMLTRVMVAGATFHVLAGCLVEDGKKWTRAEAERNAAIFSAITDIDDKLRMRSALVGFVIGFFASGAESSETSRRSSSPSEEGLPTGSGDPRTSEISPQSSDPSPEAIPFASTT